MATNKPEGWRARDIIDGRACSQCGVFFRDPETGGIYAHGYPVVCDACWSSLTMCERENVQPAEVGTMSAE